MILNKLLDCIGLYSKFLNSKNCSGFDSRVEESVNVDDVLEESPLLLVLDISGGFNLNSFNGGEKGSYNDLLEHF